MKKYLSVSLTIIAALCIQSMVYAQDAGDLLKQKAMARIKQAAIQKHLREVGKHIVHKPTSTAAGTWNALNNNAPDYNCGVIVLLTNGTVMCLTTDSSGIPFNTDGNTWDLLTPDSTGSYVNGTWTQLPQMNDTRLYCATQVLPSGNVYVAGGEYGTGGSTAELFNTTTQTWTYATGVPKNWIFADGNSEILPNGTVLQGVVLNKSFTSNSNLIYTESTNSFSAASACFGTHDEVAWVKLPDSSIMNVDEEAISSERYIPQQKKWVKDANLPNYITDFTLGETGPAFLLPNGKAFFLSDSAYAAIYTPSGNASPGSWAAGPAMPGDSGVQLGCPDAPAAMMPDGNILCGFGPAQTYNSPMYLYIYNYRTNAFTQIGVPGGGDTVSTSVFASNMLNLPDGSILTSFLYDNTYYEFVPSDTPVSAGKPTIDNIISNCPNFKITGKLFNGISEGAAYGDDWQMSTNYPIVRLTKGTNVYYATTTNWNRIGAVMTGSLEDTANFLIPLMPTGTYSVQVIANGIASNPYSLTVGCTTVGIPAITPSSINITVHPNPATGVFTFESSALLNKSTLYIYNMLGQQITKEEMTGSTKTIDISQQPTGVYNYKILSDAGVLMGTGKLVLEK